MKTDLSSFFVGALDDALEYIAELEARLQEMSMGPQTVLNRFCVSDQTMTYYTRFPSQEVFQVFWESVLPLNTIYSLLEQSTEDWTRGDSNTTPFKEDSSHWWVFIYCCRVATGLKEQVIADIFQVSTAEMVPTPSWIFPLGCGTSKGETSNKNVTVFFYIVVITDVF